MVQTIINLVHSLPNELIIVLLAAMPVVELRAAIPVAVNLFHFSAWSAYLYSVIGNTIPLVFLFLFLPKLVTNLSKISPKAHQIFEHYFFRLSKKHGPALDRYGSLFLFVFVAIPHPGGGVWTASLLAILFRLHPRFAIPAILGGMCVSGLIMLSLSEASLKFL